MKRLTLVLALLAFAGFGLAACGGDDEESAAETTTSETAGDSGGADGGGGGSVTIEADPDGALAFTETSATVPAGEVTVEFDNPASLGHDVVVEDADGNELIRTDVISADTATASGQLEAGDYTFYCSVSNHRESGMEGTLTAE